MLTSEGKTCSLRMSFTTTARECEQKSVHDVARYICLVSRTSADEDMNLSQRIVGGRLIALLHFSIVISQYQISVLSFRPVRPQRWIAPLYVLGLETADGG